MKVTTEPLENRQLAVTIEVDEARTQQAMRRAARQIAGEVRIPGFRLGKAPYDVIVQRFGESTVRREAADLLAEDVVREALAQESIEPYAPGQMTELNLDPLTFKLAVSLNPTVDLGDYRSYRLEPEPVTVTNEQVQEAFEKLREENTIFESIDRPAEWNDGLALDLVARTDSGDEVLKGDGLHMVLEAGNTDPVPGFPEAVLGVAPGQQRVFRLMLPPDFPQEQYRGQEAEFTVTVKDVYNQIIPELDDDLARTAGSFKSLEELEQSIRDRLRQAAQAEQDRAYAGRVVEAIVEQAKAGYPPAMLEQELDRVVGEVQRSITGQSRLSMDDFLRIQGQTKEELREGLTARAAARVSQALVLGEVVRLEGLEVQEEEVGARIEQASASWGSRAEQVRESLESEGGRRAMHSRLLADKAVQRLVAIAKGEIEETADDEAALVDEVAEDDTADVAADESAAEPGTGDGEIDAEVAQPEAVEPIDPVPEVEPGAFETADPADAGEASAEAQGAEEMTTSESLETGESE